ASDLASAIADARAFAGHLSVVGHNLEFDRSFLSRAGLRLPASADTLTWARIAFPRLASYRLEELGAAFGHDPGTWHDARTDADFTAALVTHIAGKLDRLPRVVQRWLELLFGPEWEWWEAEDGPDDPHPLYRAAPDPAAPSPVPAARETIVDPLELLDADGALSRIHPGWQPRSGQRQMAETLVETLDARGTVMAEAGTGVGKSLAYLLPVLQRAAHGERTVVATHTLALQDQLWGKDLPEALHAAGLEDLPVALIKGRSRYLCLLKTEDAVNEVGALALDAEERLALASLLVWLAETPDGERDDWGGGRASGAPLLWERVQADVDACAGARCRFAGPCFLRASRRQAQSSAIIVTNHALLLSAGPKGALPAYDHLVVDEAHRLGDAADQVLGFSLAPLRLSRRFREASDGRALLNRIPYAELVSAATHARDRVRLLALQLADVDVAVTALSSELQREGEAVRLDASVRARWDARGVDAVVGRTQEAARDAVEVLQGLMEDAARVVGPGMEEQALWLGIQALSNECGAVADMLAQFGDADPAWVDWWERRGRDVEVLLRRAPITPAELLGRELWSRVPGAVVLTSATLTVGGRHEYMARQLGIGVREPTVLSIPSPFQVPQQALLGLATDAPDPRDPAHPEYCREAAGRLVRVVGGRTLILTTSRVMLNQLGSELRRVLAPDQIEVLVQGQDGPPRRLIAALRRDRRTVVVGTGSFWEGVDVAGPALSLVIVTRLPFQSPHEPLEEARSEYLAAHGQNPFRARSLPSAVLRFQQGFGRLLRTESDRGAVVVLDPRIVPAARGYGALFVNSLPGPSLAVGTIDRICGRLEQFLVQEEAPGASALNQR
ncbi:MAG: helicase C-terminal domain-containing protein, partial [Clostridia bacterium]